MSRQGEKTVLLITLAVVILMILVFLVAWLVNDPFLYRYGFSSSRGMLREADVRARPPSVLYEVFLPVVVFYDSLVDFFRPSHLRMLGCQLLPANPQRVRVITSWVRACY